MASFCNQCARELGLPEGDFADLIPKQLVDRGYGQPVLCEGCVDCLVDDKGNCVAAYCRKEHGMSVQEYTPDFDELPDLFVLIESPYNGHPDGIEGAERYAKACMKYAIDHGATPLASHLLYTQVLDDRKPEERAKGKQLGWKWLRHVHEIWVFVDYGMTEGMIEGLHENNDLPGPRPTKFIKIKDTEHWPA